ncbi:MAG TPA: head GIN domain-containing protein [Anaerolineales bacterium]|nr:head GIN domain-containing protein [Anaerolineales bacterium]
MKRIYVAFLIALFFVPSLACGSFGGSFVVGSGNTVSKDFDVSGFDHVRLEGSADVYIEQGSKESLSVEADDNIIPVLDVSLRNHELVLSIKEGYSVKPSRSITYYLTVQDLSDLSLIGSGDFYVGPIESDDLNVSVPGSGDIIIDELTADSLSIDLGGSGSITLEDISVKTVDASVKGSGDIKLAGTASTQTVKVGGSGNYLAGDLETSAADIDVQGSADVVVWANDELDVAITGSADVQYYGKPKINQNRIGSGDFTSLGDK